jgi:hypothetical protein
MCLSLCITVLRNIDHGGQPSQPDQVVRQLVEFIQVAKTRVGNGLTSPDTLKTSFIKSHTINRRLACLMLCSLVCRCLDYWRLREITVVLLVAEYKS